MRTSLSIFTSASKTTSCQSFAKEQNMNHRFSTRKAPLEPLSLALNSFLPSLPSSLPASLPPSLPPFFLSVSLFLSLSLSFRLPGLANYIKPGCRRPVWQCTPPSPLIKCEFSESTLVIICTSDCFQDDLPHMQQHEQPQTLNPKP